MRRPNGLWSGLRPGNFVQQSDWTTIMLATIADLAHPLFQAGLALRERLNIGEMLHRDPEQERFLQMLDALDAVIFLENDSSDLLPIDFAEPSADERERLTQATVRYLLVCWLDELIGAGIQGESWREQPLETFLYAQTTGSTKFWDEARYAEARGDRDALEVAYWCVMLGFRGCRSDTPAEVDAWTQRVRMVLARPLESTAMPASLEPPLSGRQPILKGGHRPWAFAFYVALTVLAPIVGLVAWRFSGGIW